MKKMLSCPHCQQATLELPPLPGDVVAVLVCRECREWSALYRGRMIPLKRQVLEGGAAEEKREYLAQIMAQIMAEAFASMEEDSAHPISEEEFAAFREEELDRLDDPEFFHRVFG